jgi:hypothetical protein
MGAISQGASPERGRGATSTGEDEMSDVSETVAGAILAEMNRQCQEGPYPIGPYIYSDDDIRNVGIDGAADLVKVAEAAITEYLQASAKTPQSPERTKL